MPQRVVYRWLISLLAWPVWRIVIPIASMVDAFTKELSRPGSPYEMLDALLDDYVISQKNFSRDRRPPVTNRRREPRSL